MSRRERPTYLVVATDGCFALGIDDEAERIGPELAAELAGPIGADRPPEVGPPAGTVLLGAELVPPCPVVVLVTSDGLSVRDRRSEREVPLSASLARLLAESPAGVQVTDERLADLSELVAMGLLEVRRPTDSGDGYLRPSHAVHPDEVGEPGVPGCTPVYSVCASHIAGVPLGLGMLSAAARAHDGGRLLDTFDLRPLRRETATTLSELTARPEPSVVLFSNYLWSVADNLELSAEVRRRSPGSVIVHGGPSTPRYEGDAAAFLRDHPEIDVLVLGEGEATVVELLDRLTEGLDVDRLVGLAGTVVRASDGTVQRGPDRERIADLSQLPSPYLTGLFDHLDGGLLDLMPVETNRGCPYGCTFCDWGSATNSRIRTFPLDRVFAELEWIARRGVGTLFIADANFGVLPRDLEIAQRIAELRRRHGAPRAVLVSFAKNQTLRAAEIVRVWIEAGIATEGSVALQTTDEATLEIINRRNIRVERYDELTEEFRKLGLPLAVDLMLGLPGSTVDSFAADLQRCIDRELTARIYPTVVLPNSPMNDPDYRASNALKIDGNGVVVGSSSFDDADYAEMLRLRRIYRAGDHFGVLRHLARWLQRDLGVRAVDLYRAIDAELQAGPSAWPQLFWLARHFARFTVPPPGGWAALDHELRRLLELRYAIGPSSALDTALTVQWAHAPEPGATFPRRVPLLHDYVTWAEQLAPASGAGPYRRLDQFGPGELVVEDPRGVCGDHLAAHLRFHPHPDVDSVMLNEFWIADDWELASPLMRRLPQVIAGEQDLHPAPAGGDSRSGW